MRISNSLLQHELEEFSSWRIVDRILLGNLGSTKARMRFIKSALVLSLALPIALGAQATPGSLVPTRYNVGWQAQNTLVTASSPFDRQYFAPPGGQLDGVGALLIYRKTGTFLCTGSLCATNHILTAAHCVTNGTSVAQIRLDRSRLLPS